MIAHSKRAVSTLLAVGALLAGTAGCTLGIPKNLPKAGAGSSSPPPKPHGQMTIGVDLSVTPQKATGQEIISWGQRDIAYMANTLHVQSVGIDFPLVIPGEHSNDVKATAFATPTVDEVKQLTHIAHTYKLQVQYRVLFRVPGRHPRLSPPNPSTFFSNLLAAEKPYLQTAQAYGVNQFIVGTEQAPVERQPGWKQFEAQAAQIYHGTLSYAMWGGEPSQGGVFWGQGCIMPFKQCGITFYPDANLPSNASVTQLAALMEKDMSRLPAKTLENMAIDEMGIPAVNGAYAKPWDWLQSGTVDDNVQANWLAAGCKAARTEGMQGLWIWWMPIQTDPSKAAAANDFAGRSAAVKAVQTCAQVTSKSA